MTRSGLAWLALVLSTILCGASSPRAVDLRNVLNGYSLTTWGTNNGLPSSEVLAIAQDADGFLWLGTDSGLVRFDGTRFVAQEGPTVERSVRALHVSPAGELWVGLGEQGGILRYARSGPGQLVLLDSFAREAIGVGAIRAIVTDREETVWAGHLGGLYRFDAGQWTRCLDEGARDLEVHSLAVDGTGALLVGSRRGILRASAHDGRSFVPVGRHSARDDPVTGISVDAGGAIWRTDGLHGLQGRIDRGAAPLIPAEIARGNRLLHDRAGHLWIGTGGQGLWRVSERPGGRLLVEQTTVTTGLLGNGVVSLFEDRDGNVWAGTLDGLNRLTRFVATPVQSLGLVSGVEITPAGSWVMTADSLRLFPAGSPVDAPVIKHAGEVKAMHADETGRLWISTGHELWWFDRDGRRRPPLPAGRLANIALIASDRQGGLWVYDADRGLHRQSVHGIAPAAVPPHLARAKLTWMDTTREGTLWLATAEGQLARVDRDGRVEEHGPHTGLNVGPVRAWHVGSDGTLWVGGSSGLGRVRGSAVALLDELHGHRLVGITAIEGDESGRLWIGTRSGVIRVSGDDLSRGITSGTEAVSLAHLTKADGLAGSPRWYGHRGAILDPRGRLWFVTSRGVSVIDPDVITGARPVHASVDSVVVDGHASGGLAQPTLAPGTKRLDIQFTALALTAPATIRFRYRLDGFDTAWVDAGLRRNASYTNLPPGQYRFHVMATNTDGTWPEHATSWAFTVEPAFYQTVVFAVACIASTLGLVALGWRLHLRRVRAETAILLAERARVAREIHDTLLQGLFGVALRCEALAGELAASSPQVSAQFGELRRGVEQYVREARQSILGLRSPTLERLGLPSALRAAGEQLTSGTPVRFVFEASGSGGRCRAEFEEHLLRIGQEAISNAVRHARASTVHAALRYAPSGIVLRVSDDGEGVDHEAALRAGGLGLAGMRERARAAGGSVEITSGAGRGTTVEVTLPYGPSNAAA